MILLTEAITAEDGIALAVVVLLSFMGSIAQDYLALFNCQRKKSFIRILLSTTTASIIIFAFSPWIIDKVCLGFRGLAAISFIGGLVGFELLQKISNINGLLELIREYLDVLALAKKILSDKKEPKDDETLAKTIITIDNIKKNDKS